MKHAVEHAVHEFAGVRTGKASPGLVENLTVKVTSYGTNSPLKQLANILTPEARLITIQPFDPGTIHDIERAIKESKLGINPSVDGKSIRLPIPELSEERRKDMVKLVKDMAEHGRVSVRQARHTAMDAIKKHQKDGEITEDDLHRLQKEIQELTDSHVKEIDEHVAKKETDIITV